MTHKSNAAPFLCKGTGFKLHFNAAGNCTSFRGHEAELEGRWVALVPAEDNEHMKSAGLNPARSLLQRAAEFLSDDVSPDEGGSIEGYELLRDISAILKGQP